MASAVFLRAAVALSGRFPVLAGIDLTVAPGEILRPRGTQRGGQDVASCGPVPACCRSPGARPSSSATTCGARPSAVRRQVGMLGHAAALYDELNVVENIRFAVRAAGAPVDGIDDALDRLGLVGRLRRTAVGPALGRPAPAAGPGRPAGPAPRPVVARRTPCRPRRRRPQPCWATSSRDAVADGATVLLASHEPEASLPLAHRVVALAGGRHRPRAAL